MNLNAETINNQDQINNEDVINNLDAETFNSEQDSALNESDENLDNVVGDVVDDDVVVTIGEESQPQEEQESKPAPDWVRELRKSNREKERKIKELEAKLSAPQQDQKQVELGKKPKLEDYDYDAENYELALQDWYERKKIIDDLQEKAKQQERSQQEEWNNRLNSYSKAKAELKVKDFEDAEMIVQDVLNVTQQGIVVQGAENPALVVYALGKNAKKAQELSKITDPIKFAFAVAKLEKELKVTNKKAIPQPEKTVSGTARSSGSIDSTLERLRAEAEKTGDFSKVFLYKKQKQRAKT